jgi:RNA polymerase primary sigma factor
MNKRKSEDDGLQFYMKQIEPIPVLTREEEEACVRKAERGDQDAKKKLILSNLKFVVKMAHKYRYLGLPLLDLINEGNIGLIIAVDRYEINRGVKFISYARYWILHYILKAIYNQSSSIKEPLKYVHLIASNENNGVCWNLHRTRMMHRPASLNQGLSEDNDSEAMIDNIVGHRYTVPEKAFIDKHLKETIHEIINRLKPIEREVIHSHYGLNGKKPVTFREIGQRFNLTRERIRQIEQTALCKLRSAMMKNKVLDFVVRTAGTA